VRKDTEKTFVTAIYLTGFIFLVELFGGIWTGSLALVSDAAHVFLDVFALVLSYGAIRLSTRPASLKHTYVLHRLEVLAALLNGITLLAVSFGIFSEAYKRFLSPLEIKSGYMLIIASAGLLVNIYVAKLFHKDNHSEGAHTESDINIHSAYLHVLGDVIASIGVIVGAIIIYSTGWRWVDPFVSLFIGVIILSGAFRLISKAIHILLEGTPDHLDINKIKESLLSIIGIQEIHDLHVWNICSGHIALSAHMVSNAGSVIERDQILVSARSILHAKYNINHVTIQIENTVCSQSNCG
jgi:cobalt-zinc-cadmium efflux system protein